jgi:dipeptidyl aminopeptidase/acylaminoacyl peptidase
MQPNYRSNYLLWAFFGMLSFFSSHSFAQLKEINHQAYDNWKKIEKIQISPKGKLITYEITPLKGDGYLYIQNNEKNQLDSILKAKEASISANEDFIAYKISPRYDTLRKCELKKIDKKKWPKDSLFIHSFLTDSTIKIPKVKSYAASENSNVLVYMTEKPESIKDKKKEKKKWFKKKKPVQKEIKSDGFPVFIYSPNRKTIIQKENITDYSISKDGKFVALIYHEKDKIDSNKLILYDVQKNEQKVVISSKTAIQLPVWNKTENKMAFLFSADTSKTKQYNLAVIDLSSYTSEIYGDTTQSFFGKETGISEHRKPIFTEDNRFLFFGVSKRNEAEKPDSLLDSEKPRLDIWHYQDKTIQPQQLVNLKRDEKKNQLCVLDMNNQKIIGISSDTLEVNPNSKLKSNFLLGRTSEKYKIESQWTSPSRNDYYRISLVDGSVIEIAKGIYYPGSMSPNGKYFSYFDPIKKQYLIKLIDSNLTYCASCDLKNINQIEDVNGMPMLAGPVGEIGYTTNEESYLFRSEYDIWAYDFESKKVNCLTELEGEKNKIRFEPMFWSSDSIYIDFDNLYLKGFNTKNKSEAIYQFVEHQGHTDLKPMYGGDFSIIYSNRSEDKKTILMRKSTVSIYPDLIKLDSNWANEKRISYANPEQRDYIWTNVELTSWKSYSGIPLEGLIYKPTNFDAAKKYPLIIYYYELNSDELHAYHAPRPTASVIHPTEYASAGYVVFIPDIRYKPGYPAKGAYDCIMSGTDHVLKLYKNIDSTRMGLQGQSWGGYQTAQLITMTKRYAAAMAGAPVSNMFSAYGGIRWGSGLNRQFQYESTQSRIGKTIWEAPELYIENSPLFHLNKVNTPLLIMSNDQDGAVPWYQGIELYTGMRRLGKPCWMLNYNGDDHNLTKLANKIDLSIRMRQFFDYYLLNKPAPIWLIEGLPAIEKGKTLKYDVQNH